MTIDEIERKLGNPAELIVTHANRSLVTQWLILKGAEPIDVHGASSVSLANMYHARRAPPSAPTELQQIAASIFMEVVRTVQAGGFDPEAVRAIAREEIAAAPGAARILNVVNNRETVQLTGAIHYATETVIKIASLGHPVMMVGPAGCGKTTIGEQTAKALSLPFYITSTINETHELTGFIDGFGKYHSTPFRQAYEHGGIWIADEIDAWDAAALLAANSALANGYCNFPDNAEPTKRHMDFRMVATANTFGTGADRVYIGRNELDAASLDRFATVNVDYDLTLEQLFCGGNDKWLNHVWKVRKSVNEKKIRHVVSTRAIIMGSAALAAGMEWKAVDDIYLFKGMSATDRNKINAN